MLIGAICWAKHGVSSMNDNDLMLLMIYVKVTLLLPTYFTE